MASDFLKKIFRSVYGQPIATYMKESRIHKAMELLRDCRARVYEVAEQVGYKDITYFSSTFKKLTGMSPSEYQDTSR